MTSRPVVQRVSERLLDLAWLRARLDEPAAWGDAPPDLPFARAIDAALIRAWDTLNGPRPANAHALPELLARAGERLWHPGWIEGLGLERGVLAPISHGWTEPDEAARHLLATWATPAGDSPVAWEFSASKPAIALRDRLLRRLAADSITIELNPSSNALICGDELLTDTGLIRAAFADAPDDGLPALTLSPDDPLTFHATMEDELAYVHAERVSLGASPKATTRALEQLGHAAWRARFTTEDSRTLVDDAPQLIRGRHWRRL